MNKSTNLEDKELSYLFKQIKDTPVHVDLTTPIMNRCLAQQTDKKISHRKTRYAWIAASALVFALLVASTGFVSPTVAKSLRQIPGLSSLFQIAGDLGLKTADQQGLVDNPDVSTTHDDLTLHVPKAVFDGTRLSLGLTRIAHNNKVMDSLNDSIKTINVKINGQSLSDYSASATNSIGITMLPSIDNDSSIIELSDLRNRGGKPFPEAFDLTLSVELHNHSQPYDIIVPIHKQKPLFNVIEPNISKTSGNITFTVRKIEATPVTTNISTTLKINGQKKASFSALTSGIQISDENGKTLGELGAHGWNETHGTIQFTDYRFEPFTMMPKTIIIKPYKHIYDRMDNLSLTT